VPDAGSVSEAGETLKLAAREKRTATGSGAWLVRVNGSSARSYCAHSPKSKASRDGETRGAKASPRLWARRGAGWAELRGVGTELVAAPSRCH